ncbi:MAG: T9SS type A sorting domain-containing protein [Candidatus Eisenbacteria bacterium]|nr:T9SS type A sorting domain-containing protein [Candidatus Eisenbacteria bacterium]
MWISALIAAVLTSTPVTLPAIEAHLDDGTSPQIEAERMLPEPGLASGAPDQLRAARSRSCSRTAQSAHRACRFEVQDDFWIQVGKCLQESNPEDRDACLEEAGAAMKDDLALCGEQYEARLEVCEDLGEAAYDPEIEAEDFLSPEEAAADPNPYFPLVPGTTWVYRKAAETIEVTVTEDTIEILGVLCTVIRDVVTEGGVATEDTEDYYAQDEEGNVWYFGELSRNFEDGRLVSLDGSWIGGIDGARPGIIMLDEPEEEDEYRQEFLLGDAEDLAEVLSSEATETAPAGSCNGSCVQTLEYTPIEPGHEAHKFYAPGIGSIVEISLETGVRTELISFTSGRASGESRVSSALAGLRVLARTAPSRFESTIRFSLPGAGEVKVEVFDASGRRVRELFDGPLGSGDQSLAWDRRDDGSNAVPSGIYFVRVASSALVGTAKLVVTR